jgi:3-oxoacyl-[acyl-carrier-protein] synthase III
MSSSKESPRRAAIVDVGVFLPPKVGNDVWPAAVVAAWRAAQQPPSPAFLASLPDTPGTKATLRALQEIGPDVFAGCVERPVMPAAMTTSEMEVHAAKDALARTRIAPDAIDLLLHQSTASDVVLPSNGYVVHEALGLPGRCGVFTVDAENDSFLAQLAFAHAHIQAGMASTVLLVQSSQRTRLMDPRKRHSVLFGDGATAVVVRAVDNDDSDPQRARGVLGVVHHTDSGARHAYEVRARDHARWHDGKVELIVDDEARMQRHFLGIVDRAQRGLVDLFAVCGVDADAIDAYFCHQPNLWFRRVSQEVTGMTRARAFDTFAHTGSVGACNLPLSIRQGLDAGGLDDGALVAFFSGGAGVTTSSALVRWGA